MNIFFDPLRYRCPSRRSLVYGRRGMVCTSQPLAAQAGLDILKKGGNAFDAALATAACLAVVEPMSCNMGGDGFALIWHQGKLYGLNASGPAPALLSVEALKQAGYKEMPKFGWEAVTVPGVTSGGAEINKRFGKLPLTEIFAPAAYGGRGCAFPRHGKNPAGTGRHKLRVFLPRRPGRPDRFLLKGKRRIFKKERSGLLPRRVGGAYYYKLQRL